MNKRDEVLEKLADLEHARWARWQKHLHGQTNKNADGSLTISAKDAAHWERQIATPYSKLSEREKDSDRKEAQSTIDTLEKLGALSDDIRKVEWPRDMNRLRGQ